MTGKPSAKHNRQVTPADLYGLSYVIRVLNQHPDFLCCCLTMTFWLFFAFPLFLPGFPNICLHGVAINGLRSPSTLPLLAAGLYCGCQAIEKGCALFHCFEGDTNSIPGCRTGQQFSGMQFCGCSLYHTASQQISQAVSKGNWQQSR